MIFTINKSRTFMLLKMNLCFYIPTDIIYYIRDMAFDTPRNNYRKVMTELEKIHYHPTCSELCSYKPLFMEGSFIRRPIFIPQCYKRCFVCNSKVSRDYHTLCHSCCEIGTMEFSYHHNICQK